MLESYNGQFREDVKVKLDERFSQCWTKTALLRIILTEIYRQHFLKQL